MPANNADRLAAIKAELRSLGSGPEPREAARRVVTVNMLTTTGSRRVVRIDADGGRLSVPSTCRGGRAGEIPHRRPP